MGSVEWLADASEASLRSALRRAVPDLAEGSVTINPRVAQPNPLYWSASAVVDDGVVVKYAWSEVRAVRLWREGVVLQRLGAFDGSLPIPEVVAVTTEPALVVTRRVAGDPLSWEWASGLDPTETEQVAEGLASFLVRLHDVPAEELLADLPVVLPTPQSDTDSLRARFHLVVDRPRAATVWEWCAWVDEVLDRHHPDPAVVVHGDLHGYNQVWDLSAPRLRAVVDFEESGIAEAEFDLRYLPGNAATPDLTIAVVDAYRRLGGRRLSIERIMAWNVLTVLGDALWRTEAGVALPGGGTASTWVDDLARRLASLDLP
jgi:aminoglycoside phosphotransferase (APT) family kinase protein